MIAALPLVGHMTFGSVGIVVVVVGSVVVVVPGSVVVVVVVDVVVVEVVVDVVEEVEVEVEEVEPEFPVAVAAVGLTSNPTTRALPAPSNQNARQNLGTREGFTALIYLPERMTWSRL